MKIDYSGDEIKIFDFDAAESYKIARRLEGEGIEFYKRLGDLFPEGGIKDITESLLAEEEEHLKFFEGEVRRLHAQDDYEELVDIASAHIFYPEEELKRLEKVLCTKEDAVKLAISIEKKAIAFYKTLLGNTSDAGGRAALEKIIGEEECHEARVASLQKEAAYIA